LKIAAAVLAFCTLGALGWWRFAGIHPAVVFGGVLWIPVEANDFWVPKPLALAMRTPPPPAKAGPLTWKTLAPGFEAGELPVRAGNIEVDRILLARIDPARFRFVVRNAPAGERNLGAWVAATCPTLVVNGSYFGRDGLPATPLVSDGHALGPTIYTARQGAFVTAGGTTHIADLAHQDWHAAFHGATSAMVSYPLLLAADGSSRAPKGTNWLANRSFVAQDNAGRIVIGTTKGAWFSLDRLAIFLKSAPLDLKLALNLDGGPVACQAVVLNGFDRRSCGFWEMQVDHGHAKVLPPLRWDDPPMPVALEVYPKDKPQTCPN
jgi:hypothetical protein